MYLSFRFNYLKPIYVSTKSNRDFRWERQRAAKGFRMKFFFFFFYSQHYYSYRWFIYREPTFGDCAITTQKRCTAERYVFNSKAIWFWIFFFFPPMFYITYKNEKYVNIVNNNSLNNDIIYNNFTFVSWE